MKIEDRINKYIMQGVEKTKAIRELKRDFNLSEKELNKIWLEVKECYYREEQKKKKKGTGRQIKAHKEDLIICNAIKTFGEEHQKNIAQEECSELIQALSKDLRGLKHNVEEEIADVEIVLEELKRIYNKELIDNWKYYKLKRLEELIKENTI